MKILLNYSLWYQPAKEQELKVLLVQFLIMAMQDKKENLIIKHFLFRQQMLHKFFNFLESIKLLQLIFMRLQFKDQYHHVLSLKIMRRALSE